VKTILHGPRLPDDATVPVQILYWALTPIRLFKQRTAVNLVVSYVAMALITITLLLFSLVAVILYPQLGKWFNLEEVAIDSFLGEQARAYAQWLDPDTLAVDFQGGLDGDERASIENDLEQIVAASVPGFDQPYDDSFAYRIAHVAIVDTSGMVIASDDQAWIEDGQPISAFGLSGTREVAARAIMLDGTTDPSWGGLYSMAVTNERTSAAYPLVTNEGDVIGIIVLEGNPIRQVLGGESRAELLRYFAGQYRQLLWVFALPAVVVAIPFGVWRAGSISRRLEKMANAADAMAEGELDTRIAVKQRDEIGRLGERFNEMAQTIENNERMRRAFISNVSHELRTPISIIQATIERQLEHSQKLDPEQANAYRVIHRESDMLARMIADLFTLTRGSEQNLRLERKAISLSELAGESVRGIRDLAWSQSRVSVESLVSPDLPQVYADPTRIKQILNNLLYNSLRHTPEGGLVVVQAKVLGEMVEVSVSDTGRGIPDDEIDHVFDRYYQAERGQRHDDGSGLGLSIVKQLVVAHGGTVEVESRRDEGTTFRFTLPQAPG